MSYFQNLKTSDRISLTFSFVNLLSGMKIKNKKVYMM